MKKKKVLFICKHNSARSQMAEGLLRTFYGEHYEAYSAGTEPTEVHPLAIKVMSELGIDISSHYAKAIDEFKGITFDYVVSVCDLIKESCPFFPNEGIHYHKDFKDPASVEGDYETKINAFRSTRDEIKKFIDETFGKKTNN